KRMPVILPDEEASEWITEGLSRDRIAELARYAISDELLEAHTIRKDFQLLQEPREPFEYAELPVIP
ncbi:MAG: hypothetical protein RLZZ557_1578, partial [Bacteroidota bacterium]